MKKSTSLVPLGAVTLLLLSSCGGEEPPPEKVIRPVRYQAVVPAAGARTRTFSGAAQAGIESKLSFRVAGIVSRLAVKVGERVTEGRLIAELDPTDYQLLVQEAEASLVRATAQGRNAEANYGRVRALYENENASKNDLDAARAGAESTRAQVLSAEKNLELARLRESYTRLAAPASGVISAVSVEVNENVAAGQSVVTLSSGTVPEVQVGVPEILIARVKTGDVVSVTFDSIADEDFSATVTEVGVALTGLAAAFPVTVQLSRRDRRIRPGMAAEVRFSFGQASAKDRFIVPTHAVSEDDRGRFVYVVEGTDPGFGIARRREVEVGELSSGGIEVLKGLSPGDRVITAGITRITDGLAVRIFEEENVAP